LDAKQSGKRKIMPIVNLPLARISYLDEATAQKPGDRFSEIPILLLHGFSSSITDNWVDTNWVKFLVELGLRVIALDNRGHGNSEKFYSNSDYSIQAMANDAIELLDHLDVPKVHLLGYSMGSRIASRITMDHPGRVRRVVMGGNGYVMVEGSGDWTLIRDGLLANSIEEIADPRAIAFRRFAERTRSDRRALAACSSVLRQVFSEEQFSKIINPVLVAIGSDDDIAGSGEKLANCMENARFFSIPNRDHMRASTDKVFMNEVAVFLTENAE
jgi:pimeloyl-ACP methyl ester carboxylesterase